MNRLLQAQQQAANPPSCPSRALQATTTNSRCSLHRRRAAAAAVCAQEPAAGGAAADSNGSSNHQQQPGYAAPQHTGSGQQQQPAHGSSSGAADGAPPRSSRAVCPEAQLSRSIQQAATWQELLAVLLNYSTQAAELTPPVRQQQQTPPPQQQQQQQALHAAVKQLNSKHLPRLLKALARLQPPAARSTASAAAAAGKARVPRGSAAAGLLSWSRREQQQFWALTQLAFSECVEQLPSLGAWELSTTLWAASKLAQAPSPFLLRQLLEQLSQPGILAAASAQDVSMSLHAVASLAVQVPDRQLDALLCASGWRMQEAAPQALANTLWAVATLQHRPQEAWLRQLEARCAIILPLSCPLQQHASAVSSSGGKDSVLQQQQQQQASWQQYEQDSFTAHGLYQLVWSMARLQWQPTATFQAGFWSASLSQLPHMTAHGTSGVLWAVASLGLQPPQPWAAGWLSGLQAQMQRGVCGPQDLGNALWAVVRLGLRPGQDWVQTALGAAQAVLRDAGTQELSNMLWAFAKLGVRPDAAWMHDWLAAMQARMDSYCAPALASSAYALAVLKFRPPRAWAQTLLSQSQRQMPAFGAQELSNLVWALAVLGLRPGAAWFRDFEVQAMHESGSFNAQELSVIFWSLAKLQHTPPARWVAALLREGLEVAGGLQAQSLVLLLGSLTRWDLPQMQTAGHYRVLLPRYWAAAEQLLPQCSLEYLSVLYAARVKLGVLPSKQWSRSLLSALHGRLQALVSAQQAPLTSAAAAGTSGCGTASLLLQEQQAAAVAALQALPAGMLKPTVVSELVLSAGKLWAVAPLQWKTLRLLLAAATAVLPQCGCNLLTAVAAGLRHMLCGNRWRPWRRAVRGVRKRKLRLGGAAHAKQQQQQQLQPQRRRGGRAKHSSRRLRGSSSSARRRPLRANVTSHELWQLARPVWAAWFARSTELLLLQDASPAVPVSTGSSTGEPAASAGQPQAELLLHRPAGSAPRTEALQRSSQNPQQQGPGARLLWRCQDVSQQLRVVAALQLQAPADWLAAVLRVTYPMVSSCGAEALSWLLPDLLRLLQQQQQQQRGGCSESVQLPEGFVMDVLRRAWVLQDSTGLTQQQVLRLQSAMKQLQAVSGGGSSGGVDSVEWQQWQRLLSVWRANSGR